MTVARLQRDKAELEEVNARLTQQLAQARAAQLAATKVQLPRLAESLLHEKNQEIDALHRQLQLLHHHSTANSLAGSSRDSRLSGERMRDAFPAAMPSAELSYLTSRMEGRDTHPDKPRPFLETGTPNSFHDARRSELSLIGVTPSPDFRIVSIRNLTLFSCSFRYFASSNSISIAESHKRPLEFPDLLDY